MNETAKTLISECAENLSLANKSEEELKEIVTRYPYFGFAHLLLAERLNKLQAGSGHLQKTALYFSNPYWLSYLLSQNEDKQPENDETVAENSVEAEQLVSHEILPAELASDLTSIPDEQAQADESIETANPENERLSKILGDHLAEFKKPVEADVIFPVHANPYYTVDYFASQGIDLEQKSEKQDKVDVKVKKFTDWLKQLKNSNHQPADLGTNIQDEHQAETIANNSNEAKDILTEAMAEVLIKQGKENKAAEVYEKLSFLNPAKSVYFAAKIKELKGI